MLKSFIHTGDFHLGRPFSFQQQGNYYGKSRRKELWVAFDQVIAEAKEKEIELIVVAGDLFDSLTVLTMDIKRVAQAFASLKHTWVVMVTGNHDYYGEESPYSKVTWPENVYVFKEDQFRSVYIQDLNTEIYGYSWLKNTYREFPQASFDRLSLNTDRYNMLLMHGDVASQSDYLPIDLRILESKAFNAVCLGHIHKPGITASGIAYCGSPIPLHFGETGNHGFFSATVEKDPTTGTYQTNNYFKTIDSRRFESLEIELTPEDSYADILEKALTVDSKEDRMCHFYRLKFFGFIDPEIHMDLILDDLEEDFYYLETDSSELELDIDLDQLRFENKGNAIGRFLDSLEAIEDEEIKERAILYSIEAMISEGVLE